MWTDIEMDDALELLGPSFIDGRVRAYAVKQLDRADDEVRIRLRISFASSSDWHLARHSRSSSSTFSSSSKP